MEKPKLKRKLIASLCFDLGTSPTAFESPSVNVFWEIGSKKKPFQMTLRLGWIMQAVNYPYRNVMDYLKNKSWVDLAKFEITERFPQYKGKLKITDNEFYLSETGKCIAASKSQGQVERWINKSQL